MAGNGIHHRRSESTSESDDEICGELEVDSNGKPKLTFDNYKPSRDEMVKELAKKRTLGMNIPDKIISYITPFITQRNTMIEKIQQLQSKRTAKLVSAVEKAIPVMLKSQLAGIKVGEIMLDIHAAITAYMEAVEETGGRFARLFSIAFDPLDKAMKSAISNIQSDRYVEQNSCFPKMTNDQRSRRKYIEDGYLPIDEAHRICIGCNHSYVDEPNTNNILQEKHLKEMRVYEAKKKAAKHDAKQTGEKAKRVTHPKLVQPVRQCHCHQMYCLSAGSDVGSSCPIGCLDEKGNRYPIHQKGHCTCPICVCNCSFAYSTGAPQAFRTRQRLDSHCVKQKVEMEIQKSRLAFSFLVNDAMTNTLATVSSCNTKQKSGKKVSKEQLSKKAMSNAALAVSSSFNKHNYKEFVEVLRGQLGAAVNNAYLPVPIVLNGQETSVVSTRGISNNGLFKYRERNNGLTRASMPSPTSSTSSSSQCGNMEPTPLHPYKEAYSLPEGFISYNGSNDELDAIAMATKNSLAQIAVDLTTGNKDDSSSEEDVTPAKKRSAAKNNIVVLMTPTPTLNNNNSNKDDVYLNRVKKRAFDRTLPQPVTVLDGDTIDASSSPVFMAASPYAMNTFIALSDRANNPAPAEYLHHYHQAKPDADSQEGYHQVSDMLRHMAGQPKKFQKKN